MALDDFVTNIHEEEDHRAYYAESIFGNQRLRVVPADYAELPITYHGQRVYVNKRTKWYQAEERKRQDGKRR